MSTTGQNSTNTSLTEKQAKFLSFLKEYLQENGYPPTVRESMRRMDLTSTNSIKKYLDILERKGYIKRQHNRSRAIEIVENSTDDAEVRLIPIVGKVRAGIPHHAIEDVEGHLSMDKTICRGDNTFFLRVVGDSMIDAHIQEGDLVLVRPQPVADNGDIVVALINDEATVKRFYRQDGTIQLCPEHPTMVPIVIKEGLQDDIRIVGKVTMVVRQLDKK